MKTINKLKAPSPYMLVKALAEKEIEKLSSLIEKLAKEKFSEAKINYENTSINRKAGKLLEKEA